MRQTPTITGIEVTPDEYGVVLLKIKSDGNVDKSEWEKGNNRLPGRPPYGKFYQIKVPDFWRRTEYNKEEYFTWKLPHIWINDTNSSREEREIEAATNLYDQDVYEKSLSLIRSFRKNDSPIKIENPKLIEFLYHALQYLMREFKHRFLNTSINTKIDVILKDSAKAGEIEQQFLSLLTGFAHLISGLPRDYSHENYYGCAMSGLKAMLHPNSRGKITSFSEAVTALKGELPEPTQRIYETKYELLSKHDEQNAALAKGHDEKIAILMKAKRLFNRHIKEGVLLCGSPIRLFAHFTTFANTAQKIFKKNDIHKSMEPKKVNEIYDSLYNAITAIIRGDEGNTKDKAHVQREVAYNQYRKLFSIPEVVIPKSVLEKFGLIENEVDKGFVLVDASETSPTSTPTFVTENIFYVHAERCRQTLQLIRFPEDISKEITNILVTMSVIRMMHDPLPQNSESCIAMIEAYGAVKNHLSHKGLSYLLTSSLHNSAAPLPIPSAPVAADFQSAYNPS